MLLSNTKKWTIDMNKIGESQNSHTEWKNKKITHMEWFNSYETLEKQTNMQWQKTDQSFS